MTNPTSSRRKLKKPTAVDVSSKDNPSDYTGPDAPERVFHFNLKFIRFGTSDKIQGAAVLLSILLLLVIAGVIVAGLYNPTSPWIDKVFGWLSAAFLFVVGVAVGRSGNQNGES
jgi:hypothetical protein